LFAAVGDAASVVNVGAGVGSYEPRDRRVVAVEPSLVMLAQRPSAAAPVVRAAAEALPFGDGAFDAAMGVLTVHHWRDRAAGLAEIRRVSRGPVVLFLRDPPPDPWWWLYHYFPATAELEAGRQTPIREIADALGSRVEITPIPIPADCIDGFNAAYWRRPHAYLDPRVWKPMSALALIPDDAREEGMQLLRADLDSGEWRRRWGHLLGMNKLDLGYRVLRVLP
jgi:SAM-dependent methyltransferase